MVRDNVVEGVSFIRFPCGWSVNPVCRLNRAQIQLIKDMGCVDQHDPNSGLLAKTTLDASKVCR